MTAEDPARPDSGRPDSARPAPTAPGPATTVTIGTQIIGTYEVESLINRGGMGEVYRGRNIHNGEAVAIKIVLPSVANDPKYVALFEKEAVVLEKLSHEAIVRYRVFTIDPLLRRPCLIMEFVSGVSLHDRMAEGPMPLSDVRRVLRRVASGLDKAHTMGVVHRDLSPDNVILEDGLVDHAKIIDFGIARSAKFGPATQLEGQFAGKYGYVSPEQMGDFGGNVDGRSDIYSLGLLIAGLSRGSMLPMGASIFEAVQKRRDVPDLTGVDPDLVPILTHMLRPDPAHRPASMGAVIAMLDNPALIPAGLLEDPEDLQRTVVGQPLPLRPRPAPGPAPTPDSGATRMVDSPSRLAPPRPAVAPPAVAPPASARPAPSPAAAADRAAAPATSGGRGGLLVAGAVVLLAAAAGGAWVSGVFGPGTPPDLTGAPAVVAGAPPADPAPPADQAPAIPAPADQVATVDQAAEALAAAEARAAQVAEAARIEAAAQAERLAAQEAAALEAAAAARAAQDLRAREAAWIAARPPEPCLFVTPVAGASVTDVSALESLAASADPVDRLTADFAAEFGSPPRIVPTSIAPAQCAALDFAALLRGGDAAAQAPAPQITLNAPDGRVKGGETVRGVVETGGKTGAVALFSVGPTGAVTDLGEFLQPSADGRARFAFPTAWADPAAAGQAPVPLVLVAIATDRPVAAFAGLDDGYTAESVMPHLRYWLQEDGQPGGVGLRALTLTP